jgi:hypothetical protein
MGNIEHSERDLRLRAGSFSVEHATGEKRPVVFLHVASAEIESLHTQLEGAVAALREFGRHKSHCDIRRGTVNGGACDCGWDVVDPDRPRGQ